MEKYCCICGKVFICIRNQNTCSSECRKINDKEKKNQYMRVYRKSPQMARERSPYHKQKRPGGVPEGEKDPFRGLTEHRKTDQAIAETRSVINKTEAEARAMGMSYGRLMALRSEKK